MCLCVYVSNTPIAMSMQEWTLGRNNGKAWGSVCVVCVLGFATVGRNSGKACGSVNKLNQQWQSPTHIQHTHSYNTHTPTRFATVATNSDGAPHTYNTHTPTHTSSVLLTHRLFLSLTHTHTHIHKQQTPRRVLASGQ